MIETHIRGRPRARWTVLPGLLFALLALVGCGVKEPIPTSDLRLLWTGAVQGFVEPCGCTAGRIGGLDRIADYVRRELARHPAALFVDTGDLIQRRPLGDDLQARQTPLKAEAFLKTYADLGIAAMAVGDLDIEMGAERLAEIAERVGVPLVNGNIVRRDGRPVFRPYVVVERGGRRIGIFSVLPEFVRSDDIDDRRSFDVAKLVGGQGLFLLSWRDTAREIVAKLRTEERCDLVFAASHLGWRLNQELVRTVPGIDIAFGPHFDASKESCTWVDDTPVLTSAVRGARVGTVDWWWPKPREYFRGERPGPLLDVTARTWPVLEARILRDDLASLEGRMQALGEAEFERRRITAEQALVASAKVLADAPPWPNANAFSAVLVPMHAAIPRDEFALASIDAYHGALDDFWRSSAPPSPFPTERFRGPDACASCHPLQTDFWRGTAHSRAIHSLAASRQALDLECIGCHTVGLGVAGGFRHPAASVGFENVQCAACHGPEGGHLAGGASYLDKSLFRPAANACVQCHDKEHDPPFQQTGGRKLLRVRCPPLEPPGEGPPALREALLAGARALESTGSPPWALISDAYHRAGDPLAAVAAARAAADASPDDADARVRLAQRHADAGEWEEALRHVEGVLAGAPEHVVAWQFRAAALLRLGRTDEALEAALEALSRRPTDTATVALVVRAHFERGDRARAVDVLRQHLSARPDDAAVLEPLRLLIGG